jgi:hypothetical protein
MPKSVATTLLNRLVFLAAIVLAVNAYTQTSCSSGANRANDTPKTLQISSSIFAQ